MGKCVKKGILSADLEIILGFLESLPGSWKISAKKCGIHNEQIQNFKRKFIQIASSNRNSKKLIEKLEHL